MSSSPLSPAPVAETRTMKEIGLSNLAEALRLISAHEKTAYLEALRRVPDLVERESDPIRFLRYANFDAAKAAQHLVKFWEIRAEIFGLDRAFLPMRLLSKNCSGSDADNSALSQEDFECLQTGYLSLLPASSGGDRVLCFDGARRMQEASERSLLRCAFYAISVLSEDVRSQTDGYVVLAIMNQLSFEHLLGETGEAISNMVKQAFPAHVKDAIMVHCPGTAGQTRTFLEWIAPITHRSGGSLFGKKARSISAETKEDLFQKLETHGFSSEGLPENLGGTWSYDESFPNWIYERRMFEMALYGGVRAGPYDVAPSMNFTTSNTNLRLGTKTPKPATFDESLLKLRAAIDLIPREEKIEYVEAVDCAPYLVKTETDPGRYLKSGLGSFAAARKIVSYWRNRKLIFGKGRAFLPMNQTGEGALSHADVQTLQSGCLVPLPADRWNRPVLFWNRSRVCSDNWDPVSELRCFFYLLHVSQHDGLVVVYLLNRDSFLKPFSEVHHQVCDIIRSALPIRSISVHLLCTPPETGREAFFELAFPMTLRLLGRILDESTMVHVAYTARHVLERLGNVGFARDGLPVCLGGSWGYEAIAKWRELRLCLELQRLKGTMVLSDNRLAGLESERNKQGARGPDSTATHLLAASEHDQETNPMKGDFGVAGPLRPEGDMQALIGATSLMRLKCAQGGSAAPTEQQETKHSTDLPSKANEVEKHQAPSNQEGSWEHESADAGRNVDRTRFESEVASVQHCGEESVGKFICDSDDSSRTKTSDSLNRTKFKETEVTRLGALQELYQAIGLLPDADKAAFVEASQFAPHLIEEESNPIDFLRFENYNTWAAAKRVAKFWKRRKDLFGRKRAFCAMDLTGEGAMSHDDIELLKTGTIALLPNDPQGRSVICLDRGRLKSYSKESRNRAVFYIYWLASQNALTRERGAIVVAIYSKKSNGDFDTGFFEKSLLHARDGGSMLFKLHKAHLVCASQGFVKDFILERFTPYMFNMAGEFVREKLKIHVGDSEVELYEKLRAEGLVDLPPSVGGRWDYSNFSDWVHTKQRNGRRNREPSIRSLGGNVRAGARVLPAPVTVDQSSYDRFGLGKMTEPQLIKPPPKPCTVTGVKPVAKGSVRGTGAEESGLPGFISRRSSQAPVDTKDAFSLTASQQSLTTGVPCVRQKASVVSSRNATLDYDCSHATGTRTQDLSATTQPAAVGSATDAKPTWWDSFIDLEPPDPDAERKERERKRKRNAEYSRLQRERQRKRVESLTAQLADFRQKNQQLSVENEMLEKMLRDAQAQVAQIEQYAPHISRALSSYQPK